VYVHAGALAPGGRRVGVGRAAARWCRGRVRGGGGERVGGRAAESVCVSMRLRAGVEPGARTRTRGRTAGRDGAGGSGDVPSRGR
jgi:hypothetical protein